MEKKNEFIFTRHSIANYETYGKVVSGDNPQQKHNPLDQVVPDIPETEKRNGVILAREQAENLLDEFDPKTDILFFVSSNEARALETAFYYVLEAEKRNFQIVEHKTGIFGTRAVAFPHVDSVMKYTKNVKNYVRPLKCLSLNIPNTFESIVFSSANVLKYTNVNWSKIPPEQMERWKQARAIIDKEDFGSWGANFYFYSEAVSKIFPTIVPTRVVFETQFQQILKVIRFANKTIQGANIEKNLKVLGFGHENYGGYALHIYLQNHNIGNCESVGISLNDGRVVLNKKGRWKSLN